MSYGIQDVAYMRASDVRLQVHVFVSECASPKFVCHCFSSLAETKPCTLGDMRAVEVLVRSGIVQWHNLHCTCSMHWQCTSTHSI